MRILALGDVVGSVGCNALKHVLPKLKAEKNIDFCVVNGENSADGNGILSQSAELLFSIGADVITGGNHTFRRPEFLKKEVRHRCSRPLRTISRQHLFLC